MTRPAAERAVQTEADDRFSATMGAYFRGDATLEAAIAAHMERYGKTSTGGHISTTSANAAIIARVQAFNDEIDRLRSPEQPGT